MWQRAGELGQEVLQHDWGGQLQSHHGEDRGKTGGRKGDKGDGGCQERRRLEDKVLDLQR